MKAIKIIVVLVVCFLVVGAVAYLSGDSNDSNVNTMSTPAPGEYNIAPPPSAPAPSTPDNEEAEMIRKMKLNP